MTTWLITGCSTGLGRAFAEAVLDRGHNAVVTARNIANVQDLADAHPATALALPLDVTDDDQVTAAVAPPTSSASPPPQPPRDRAGVASKGVREVVMGCIGRWDRSPTTPVGSRSPLYR